jgi:6-pyruvoyltetrahydropterin/6-carboxytetrahydropterin synthase
MAIIRISKEFNFDMAHALLGYDGLCKNIHGHSYTLIVTVKGKPIVSESSPKVGMLIDFKDLKNLIKSRIIDKFDHSLVLNESTPVELKKQLEQNFDKIIYTPYQPTTENMIADLAEQIQALLPNELTLFSLRLRETETSFAEWFAEDQ